MGAGREGGWGGWVGVGRQPADARAGAEAARSPWRADKPGGMKLVKASVPLSEMFNYVSTLRGMTKGRAQYTMQLEKYEVVPTHIQSKIVEEQGAKAAAA